MKRSHKVMSAAVLGFVVVAGGFVKFGLPAFAQQSEEAAVEKSSTCEVRVTLLNNRTKLLTSYQRSENQKYDSERKKWAKRVAYSGKWIPQEAENVREKLYYLDTLHRNLDKELDKQIQQYAYLETQPLDCSPEKRPELVAKLKEVNGVQDKKVVSGQALIEKLKRQQTEYMNGEFDRVSKDLMTHLHQAKENEPFSKKPEIQVSNYSKQQ